MLRLPTFSLVIPTTIEEALSLANQHGANARYVAGGTDILPAMKEGRPGPSLLISLQKIPELREITQQDNEMRIGALCTLEALSENQLIRSVVPAVASAAALVASPQIRSMGTVGGNLCVDTRCRYINQSELFRQALGGCLKSHGTECHVVPGGKQCVAALSSDLTPPLIALGAYLKVRTTEGEKKVNVADLRGPDGVSPIRLSPSDLITAVVIEKPDSFSDCVVRKWAPRQAIDFPMVSLALRLDFESDARTKVLGGRLVIGALGPKAKIVELSELGGSTAEPQLADRISDMAFNQGRTLPNINYDPIYRRERLAVEARRAVLSLIKKELPR